MECQHIDLSLSAVSVLGLEIVREPLEHEIILRALLDGHWLLKNNVERAS